MCCTAKGDGIKMIKIAICDDNREELTKTRKNCMAYAAKHPEYEVMVNTFEDAKSALSQIELTGGFDIMMLDIYMPNMTGMELAEALRARKDMCEIIFLTTSENHAIDAFTLNATHYLLKPYTLGQFDAALSKAFAQLAKRHHAVMTVKSPVGMHKVLFADLIYAETDMHMQNIYLADGSVLNVRMSSTELYDSLSHDTRFFKCGSTYILNLEKIKEVTPRAILLDTNRKIHMLRRQYPTLLERYTRYTVKGI